MRQWSLGIIKELWYSYLLYLESCYCKAVTVKKPSCSLWFISRGCFNPPINLITNLCQISVIVNYMSGVIGYYQLKCTKSDFRGITIQKLPGDSVHDPSHHVLMQCTANISIASGVMKGIRKCMYYSSRALPGYTRSFNSVRPMQMSFRKDYHQQWTDMYNCIFERTTC